MKPFLLAPFLACPLVYAAGPSSCRSDGFPNPKLLGVRMQDLEVTEAHRYAPWPYAPTTLLVDERPIDFCNVTLTYTHPGWKDAVHVYVWLPLEEKDWNGRYVGLGGGGWAAGFEGALPGAVALGYAAAMTDAGHDATGGIAATIKGDWILHEPGNVNLPLVYDFAHVALDDMAKIAKRMVEAFYGKKPDYSYWTGCSTGGRQGLALAQRYPENYDGILVAAPAINWATFLISEIWGQVIMNEMDVHPPTCEFNAITDAAIEACDELDGVKDGLVSAHGQCTFDPDTVVGKKIHCSGKTHKVSQEAATIAKEVWRGPQNAAGDTEWFGMPHEASFYLEDYGPFGGLLQTTCSETSPTDGKKCVGKPFIMSTSYIRYMLAKDPDFDLNTLTREKFFHLLHQSRQEWLSVMDTADPDLSAFKASGGKILHWHGIADQLIPINGSAHYYSRVEALDPNLRDFYRYFEVPGVTHCNGGPGPFPAKALDELVDWVEKAEAPMSIEGVVGEVKRPICAWPLVAAYKGGDADKAESYECKGDFDAFGFPKVERASHLRDEL
ncbi:hypothetical protein Q7P37_007265 [Cladosporium fusiforme]